MVLNEYYTLSNGVKIPKLGLGTWFIEDSKVPEAVKQAVQIGYRHIDTAQAYGNEAGVGCGINECGVSNFLIDDLQNILDCCTIKPMVNQILTHISNTEFRSNHGGKPPYQFVACGELLRGLLHPDRA